MNLDKILKEIGTKTDKSWTYLKGLFNAANSEYAEQFGDALPDDKRMEIALIKVGKKYDLDRTEVEEIIKNNTVKISKEDKDLAEAIEDMFEEDDGSALEYAEESSLKITDDPNHGEVDVSSGSVSAWKRFLKSIPDPVVPKKDYVTLPSLIIEIGPTYYLKLTDLADVPDSREFEGKYGLYTMYPLKVTFLRVSDEDLYDVKYNTGNFEGELAFVNNKNYTLWINEKSMGRFKLFWESLIPDGEPDDRIFTYKFTKKGKYNVYTYGLPKR